MNAATNIVPLALTISEQMWVENAAEQLMLGADVSFKRFGKPAQGVTLERFHIALDDLAMARLGRKGASQSALGKIVHGVLLGNLSLAREGLSEALELPDPQAAIQAEAETLLRPLARDGAIAEQEDAL